MFGRGMTLNSLPTWLVANSGRLQGPMVARPPGTSFIDQSKAYNEGDMQPGDHTFDEGQFGTTQDLAKDRAAVDLFTQQQMERMFNERMDAYDAQNTVNEFKGGLPIRATRWRGV